MKDLVRLILVCVLFSCQGPDANHIFSELEDKENVWLVLSYYGLDSIPPQIGTLRNVKELTISLDTSNQWVVYPPSGADFWEERLDSPPFRYLPMEIAELKQLSSLDLHGLDLRTLPDNFGQLSELTYLDLSMNKLDIAKELPKLKQLKNLREINVVGNKADIIALESWRAEMPELKIIYRWEM